MKIAFDLRRIGNPGIGRYMRCLVEAVFEQQTGAEYLLLLPPGDRSVVNAGAGKTTRLIPRARYYSVREQIELPRILREHSIDLLHSPHFLLPLSRPCPAVATIHDVIYLACPQDLPSVIGRFYYDRMMRASARMAKRIITDSQFSKQEIVRYLGVDSDKVAVIYPAVDPGLRLLRDRGVLEAILRKYAIDSEYVFYTGIYKPRKNHRGLLEAFRHFIATGGTAKLVIAGPLGDGENQLRRLATRLGIADNLVFTGFVDDMELSALYSGARVYACPSTYEGFGFTVLEAMACHVPVVCSNSASLPEVAGDAAVYADAQSPEDFGKALYRAFVDEELRGELIARGRRNLQRFSWTSAAISCLELYEEVTGRRVFEPTAA
jgi:glycosyltransferase involved in cell wall biosynthesis